MNRYGTVSRPLASALFLFVLCAVWRNAVLAETVIADLSSEEVAITTGFTGAELLLFGTTGGSGDVVVTVAGPRREEIVRRKERIGGIWVNGASVVFSETPAYYRVASSADLAGVATPEVLEHLEIGVETLKISTNSVRPGSEITQFREALFRNKRRLGLYGETVSEIEISGGRLFQTRIPFPANVPTGDYRASIYLFRDGVLVSRQDKPVMVHKDGMGARIFGFAHEQAPLYGAIAILIALLAGWLAGIIFRRT